MRTKSYKELPHKRHFYKAVLRNMLFSLSFLTFSIIIGIFGYHYFFKLSWVDSFYNASMILTGMGPVDKANGNGAKLFASFYAIYGGVAFLTSVALIFSPILKRFLHRFHLDASDED